jgi:hypothetical protein
MKILHAYKILTKAFSGSKAKEYTRAIASFNRFITHPWYQSGARFCAGLMRESGFDKVEILKFPIDGKIL